MNTTTAPAVLAAYQAGRGLPTGNPTGPIGKARLATLEAVAGGHVSYTPGIFLGQGATFRRYEAGKFHLCTRTATWLIQEGYATVADNREPGPVTLTLAGNLALGLVVPLTATEIHHEFRAIQSALGLLGAPGQRHASSIAWSLRDSTGSSIIPALERVLAWPNSSQDIRDRALRLAAELIAFWGHTRTVQ